MHKNMYSPVVVTLLFLLLFLTGCYSVRISPETVPIPEQTTNTMIQDTLIPTEPVVSPEEDIEPDVTPQPETLPMVNYALRRVDLAELPEGITKNDALTEAIARAIAALLPDCTIRIRVTNLYELQAYEDNRYQATCEIFHADSRRFYGGYLTVTVVDTEAGYTTTYNRNMSPNTTEEIINTLAGFDPQDENMPDAQYLWLDNENRIWLHQPGKDIPTELFFQDRFEQLSQCVCFSSMGTIVICATEDWHFNTPVQISISRDNGDTWTTHTPDLPPIGVHPEANFTQCRIQHPETGDIYIFLGTNLASVTVLKIPDQTSDVEVLWREQLGGYETSAIVEAAMITDEMGMYTGRGFISLTHPKYAASNAIYRTTDFGKNWIRCTVPMPEEAENPWEMKLYLPYQKDNTGATWYMEGQFEEGSCVYISEDGGWTWKIDSLSLYPTGEMP